MKKLLIVLATLIALTATGITLSSFTPTAEQTETYVYICTGGSSTKYHKTPNCTGLRNCGGEIKKITKAEAERLGRTPCKICYKQQ